MRPTRRTYPRVIVMEHRVLKGRQIRLRVRLRDARLLHGGDVTPCSPRRPGRDAHSCPQELEDEPRPTDRRSSQPFAARYLQSPRMLCCSCAAPAVVDWSIYLRTLELGRPLRRGRSQSYSRRAASSGGLSRLSRRTVHACIVRDRKRHCRGALHFAPTCSAVAGTSCGPGSSDKSWRLSGTLGSGALIRNQATYSAGRNNSVSSVPTMIPPI